MGSTMESDLEGVRGYDMLIYENEDEMTDEQLLHYHRELLQLEAKINKEQLSVSHELEKITWCVKNGQNVEEVVMLNKLNDQLCALDWVKCSTRQMDETTLIVGFVKVLKTKLLAIEVEQRENANKVVTVENVKFTAPKENVPLELIHLLDELIDFHSIKHCLLKYEELYDQRDACLADNLNRKYFFWKMTENGCEILCEKKVIIFKCVWRIESSGSLNGFLRHTFKIEMIDDKSIDKQLKVIFKDLEEMSDVNEDVWVKINSIVES